MIDLKGVKRAMCIFAHPDDETLAAGGTMAKLDDSGARIHCLIPAVQDYPSLKTDCRKAIADIATITFGTFADNEMDNVSLLSVIKWMQPHFDRLCPDLVLTHCFGCTNIDHRIVNEAVTVLTRPLDGLHVPVLCGEVPSSTGYRRPTGFEPNFYVELSNDNVTQKLAAMACYDGESRPAPHPRSPEALRALAVVRGSESGFHYAEAFMLLRGFA